MEKVVETVNREAYIPEENKMWRNRKVRKQNFLNGKMLNHDGYERLKIQFRQIYKSC